MNNEEAYKKAINECIEKGILKDYLERKGDQVLEMLIAQDNYNLEMEARREEGFIVGLFKVAKNMKKENFDNTTIARITELPIEDIEKL